MLNTNTLDMRCQWCVQCCFSLLQCSKMTCIHCIVQQVC